MSRLAFASAIAFAAGLVALAAPGCDSPDTEAVSTVICGDFATFGRVSAVLEARCGTADCHGQFARPLRVYGPYGLRRPEEADAGVVADYSEYYPGGAEPTTANELADNYRSLCGLEPELMTQVIRGEAAPEDLAIVKKARLLEKHKGGRVFEPGREGDACIVGWLRAAASGDPTTFDAESCDAELAHP